MRVEIRPGTLRDITYVAANLRKWDTKEIFASAALESPTQVGLLSYYGSLGWCWTAWLDGQPHAAFGVARMSDLQPHLRSAWAWGTDRFKRCAPAITRFSMKEWPSRLIGEGVTRVEIRSLKGHDIAHKWLSAIRARREGEMTNYGVNGETFELWAWLKEDWLDALERPLEGTAG